MLYSVNTNTSFLQHLEWSESVADPNILLPKRSESNGHITAQVLFTVTESQHVCERSFQQRQAFIMYTFTNTASKLYVPCNTTTKLCHFLANAHSHFFFPGFLPPFFPLLASSSSPAAALALFLPSGVFAYHAYSDSPQHCWQLL